MSYLTLALCLILTGALFIKRSFLVKKARLFAWISVASTFALSFVFTFIQYQVWMADPKMKFVFNTAAGYYKFFFNAFMKFFAPHLLSLAFALVLFIAMKIANKRSGEKFFEKEEIWFAFIASFLSGFPGFLIFFPVLIFIYLVSQIVIVIIKKRSERIPLYYLWLPAAAFVIIISELILSHMPFWKLIIV